MPKLTEAFVKKLPHAKDGTDKYWDAEIKGLVLFVGMRLPLDEISKSMAVRRHQEMSGSPSAANHVLRIFRAIYNHARRTCDLAECPTMAIEWF